MGQDRAWKCSSAIQTCYDVAQKQIRRLLKKPTPFLGSALQYVQTRLASSRELH